MVLRTCETCGKTFNKKDRYDYHVNPNRKYPCNGNKIKISDKSLIKPQIMEKNTSPKMRDNKCFYCRKNFNRRDNLNRHIQKYCKSKKKLDEDKHELYLSLINEMDEKIKKLEKENKKIKKNNKVVNNINNINNNNTNNIQNNIQNNIMLVAYGKEDLSILDQKIFYRSLNRGLNSVPTLIEQMHFNEDYPEFHNVYIPSLKDSYAMIFNGAKWIIKDKNDTVDRMYDDKVDILEEKFQEFYDQLKDPVRKRFNNFIIRNDNINDNEVKIKAKKQIKEILYNNRDIIKNK